MARALVHPRLMQSLPNHYPQTVAIQRPLRLQDAAGQEVDDWQDIESHQALAAMVAPTGGKEQRSSNQIIEQSTHTIALRGYYPAILAIHRAVDGQGQTYNILLVEHDTQRSATYLYCEIVQ